jgi:hypothetical protein
MTLNREKLLNSVKEYKINKKLIRLVITTLEQAKCRVEVQNNLSKPSGTSVGLR